MSASTMPEAAPRITNHAREILGRVKILENPYFCALQSGDMGRESFLRTQQQFYFAVLEFPRPMLRLLGRMSHPDMRLGILENVVEEHGRFEPHAFHEATFRRFCRSLNDSDTDPQRILPGPVVDAFNSCLMGTCQFGELPLGLACLGIIEFAFADIAAFLGRTVVRHGWVASDQLVHFTVHEEIDRSHAQDFFRPLEPLWDDLWQRDTIVRGLELGAYVFDRLYRDFWVHEQR